MIAAKSVHVGEQFRLINIEPSKRSVGFILNGPWAEPNDPLSIKAAKGFEFEVTKRARKLPGVKGSCFQIKPLNSGALKYDIFSHDLSYRCERIAPHAASVEYVLHEVHPRIYCAKFVSEFDMAMTFLRYQECYESSNENFRNKSFTLTDYMRWYAKNLGNGSFTYTKDWGGFNIPSKIIVKAQAPGFIKDWNNYDEEMKTLYNTIQAASDGLGFYLIGMLKHDESTLRHEVAHGLFATNPDYRHSMTSWVDSYVPAPTRALMYDILKEMGYHDSVWRDEMQAYFCTGLTSRMQAVPEIANCAQIIEMRHAFEEFTKEILWSEI